MSCVTFSVSVGVVQYLSALDAVRLVSLTLPQTQLAGTQHFGIRSIQVGDRRIQVISRGKLGTAHQHGCKVRPPDSPR